MTFILIVIFTFDKGGSANMQEFYTLETCEQASKIISSTANSLGNGIAVNQCIKK